MKQRSVKLKFLFTAISLFSFQAISAVGYDIKVQFLKNGEILSKNQLIVAAGKEATITKTQPSHKLKTELTVIANEAIVQKRRGIMLKMDLKHWSNKTFVHNKPEVLVFDGKEAMIETYQNKEKSLIKIIATRVKI